MITGRPSQTNGSLVARMGGLRTWLAKRRTRFVDSASHGVFDLPTGPDSERCAENGQKAVASAGDLANPPGRDGCAVSEPKTRGVDTSSSSPAFYGLN